MKGLTKKSFFYFWDLIQLGDILLVTFRSSNHCHLITISSSNPTSLKIEFTLIKSNQKDQQCKSFISGLVHINGTSCDIELESHKLVWIHISIKYLCNLPIKKCKKFHILLFLLFNFNQWYSLRYMRIISLT